MSICPDCKIRTIQKHHNSKFCLPCALERRRKPRHTLTIDQQLKVRSLAGHFTQEKIAEKVKVSRSNIIRFASEVGISLNSIRYTENVVDEVCSYYEKHGKLKTQKKFPTVSVRSIVERYKSFKPRRIPWTEGELLELARMAGLISKKGQAKYFNRPGANEGSITSAWMKKFGHGGVNVNGLSWHVARHYVGTRCRPLKLKVWDRREKIGKSRGRKVVLWVDLEKHIKSNCPDWIKECTTVMADYQRWLFGVSDVRAKVRRMIKERGI